MILGIACSGLERSDSLKMIKAFMRGAEEAGHQTEIIKTVHCFSGNKR